MMRRENAGNTSIIQSETKLTMRSEDDFGIMTTFVLISNMRWYLEIRSWQRFGDAVALSSQAAGCLDKAQLEDDPIPVSACWHSL